MQEWQWNYNTNMEESIPACSVHVVLLGIRIIWRLSDGDGMGQTDFRRDLSLGWRSIYHLALSITTDLLIETKSGSKNIVGRLLTVCYLSVSRYICICMAITINWTRMKWGRLDLAKVHRRTCMHLQHSNNGPNFIGCRNKYPCGSLRVSSKQFGL